MEDENKRVVSRTDLLRRLRKINWWQGARAEGEWVRESVATNMKRLVTRFRKGVGHIKEAPNIVQVTEEELVHIHDGYRPHFEGEKKTRKSFFWRGARVWIS